MDVCQSTHAYNPSKTDFLLIGLPEQLSKLNNPTRNVTSDVTLSPVPEARNLGFRLILIYLFLVTYPLLLNLVFLILGILGVLDLFLIKLQLVILLLFLSILNLTTVTLFLNLPANQLDRLQLVLNSAARAVTRTPRFHHITPILKSLHWLKISQRMAYIIKFYL